MSRSLNILISSIVLFLSWASFCFAENLTVTMLDVGQADSILIQTAGKTVLIDAGEEKELVKNKLIERKTTDFDLIVATHPHADHVGGMEAVLHNTNVKVYMDNGFPHTTKQYDDLMNVVEEKVNGGTKYIVARQGMRLNLGPEAHFEVLWPNETGFSGTRSDINANSIVMKLTHGDNCFLFMGDAEAETEQAVIPFLDKCQVLKASHHGTPHSSIPELLDKIQPEVALISCGLANKHGHPGKTTLEALKQRNAAIYRTDWQGELTVVSDGKTLKVSTEKNLTKADLPCLDINRATSAEFSVLSGIGGTTTERIMSARQSHVGPYESVEAFLADLPEDTSHRLSKMSDYLATDCSYKTGYVPSQPASPSNAAGEYALLRPTTVPMLPLQASGNLPPTTTSSNVKVNINTADAMTIARLPGITVKRAHEIVAYRKANGDFSSCLNVKKVNGIGLSTLKKMIPACTTETMQASKQPSAAAPAAGGVVNINTASSAEIASMPGMNSSKADAAIAYREANGGFKSCADLKKVNGIGQKTVDKLLSVCTVE